MLLSGSTYIFTAEVTTMKVLKIDPEICSVCGECEKACSSLYFKEENREKAALRVDIKADDRDRVIMQACIQCGECIKVCPVQALYRAKNGVVMIKKKVCVGCFACVGFCPYSVMFTHKDSTEPFKCIACGACARVCPVDALRIEEEKAAVEA
jgi:anaerobic carbon-monoxide dehydrogenase iron sulfur subunit